MKTSAEIIALAKQTLEIERDSINNLIGTIDQDFANVVTEITNSKGRVIITGIGKSAIIAQKIVATLNSTGTPAIFLHAADAIHGDLGMVQKDDIVICISKSGNTPEIKVLVPLLKKNASKIVALTGDFNSYLAEQADYKLSCHIDREACPNNLAPTNSTTAQLVIGDALAVCLIENKGFGSEDFAKYHPGGALGKKLYLRVSDLFILNEKPMVAPEANLNDVIFEISAKRLGMTVVAHNDEVLGVITDGDLRRMLSKQKTIDSIKAAEIMSQNPKTIEGDALAVEAAELMKEMKISQLVVVENKRYLGIIHFQDLLKEGIL